ncbi:hypothetical protein Ocin01_04601 [Orchesella cincta]|uniref:Uncharacterized protein n=1 Tax=Orchesella cincta TaxID=48709 RepID=A0A1D2NAI6_ORCCI|nr:hypothetical protein Ocin01_04601 [Orchesella cincta]
MLDTRQKLRETVEANKGLSTENSKLVVKINEFEATVGELNGRLNSYSGKITTLEQNLKLKDIEKETQKKDILQLRAENSELQANLEKEKKEKEECQKKLEKIRSEVQNLEELFDDDMTENGTAT